MLCMHTSWQYVNTNINQTGNEANNYLYIHRCEASTLKVKGHGSYRYRLKSVDVSVLYISCLSKCIKFTERKFVLRILSCY